MGKTRRSAAADPKEGAGKKARTSQQQPGIAAAFAAAEQRAAAASDSAPLPELWQDRPSDLLSAALTQDLTKCGEQYLQAWGDKCFMARGEAAAAAAAKAGSSSRVQRLAAVAAESKDDADLDQAGGGAAHLCCVAMIGPRQAAWPPAPGRPQARPECNTTPLAPRCLALPAPAAMRYIDEFRHLEKQAYRVEAAFKPRHLELLVLLCRSDVLHKHGGALPCCHLTLGGARKEQAQLAAARRAARR